MKAALVIFAIAITATAEVVTTYDSRTNGTPVSTRIPSVDIGVTDAQKNPDFQLWMRNIEAPALADLNTRMIVKITGTVTHAKAELSAQEKARKQSVRAAIAETREARLAWREAERAWKQGLRDTAKALGLPATNGLTWSPSEAYSAALMVTNANTRRDLNIQLLQADLNNTRFQLEQQFPDVQWWWLPEE